MNLQSKSQNYGHVKMNCAYLFLMNIFIMEEKCIVGLEVYILRKAERMRVKLREMIDRKELVVAPGVHGPMYARLVEKAGFNAVYMTGFGSAANILGMPDVGLTTLNEMVANVMNICNVVDIPVIADMDTGFGNALNVMRAVREYESAGVAGFHIEDQVMPKKCGFMKGKAVIPMEEMVGKVKACVEAREDPNLVIIARSDCRGTQEQRGELYDRCNAYRKAGADIIFAERPESPEDLKNDLKNIKAPLLLNMILPQYGISTVEEVRKLGYAIVIFPGATHQISAQASYLFLRELEKTGKNPTKISIDLSKPAIDFAEMIGLPQVRALEEKFLPKEELEAKYGSNKVPREF